MSAAHVGGDTCCFHQSGHASCSAYTDWQKCVCRIRLGTSWNKWPRRSENTVLRESLHNNERGPALGPPTRQSLQRRGWGVLEYLSTSFGRKYTGVRVGRTNTHEMEQKATSSCQSCSLPGWGFRSGAVLFPHVHNFSSLLCFESVLLLAFLLCASIMGVWFLLFPCQTWPLCHHWLGQKMLHQKHNSRKSKAQINQKDQKQDQRNNV